MSLKQTTTLLFLSLCAVISASAATVDTDTARTAAENWIDRSAVFQAAAAAETPQRFTVGDIVRLTNGAYHVSLAPRGYIVVSGDDRIAPILCFSLDGDLNLTASPQNVLRDLLFEDLAVSYQTLNELAVRKTLDQPDFVDENRGTWTNLLAPLPSDGMSKLAYTPTNVLVSPMLETTWSQWNHYNEFCPTDPAPGSGYDGKAPVGCVAVVGAQVMKYHDWPPYALGGNTYTDSVPTVTGIFSAVFSDPYDWANMLTNYWPYSSYGTTEVDAVSELMYELGVAVNMDYGSFSNEGGSTASSYRLGQTMFSNFYYEATSYRLRSTNITAFDECLRSELAVGKPTIVSITNHAIVADGLSPDGGTNWFHFNYGWGGQNDGWYQPSNIRTNTIHSALFGSQPQFMPLIDLDSPRTSYNGVVTLSWAFPKRRTNEVTQFRLQEGVLCSSNFIDTGSQFARWEMEGHPWVYNASGGNPGECYFKTNAVAGSLISEPFVPDTNSTLTYTYKAQLATDDFYTELTTNDGMSWIELQHLTDFSAGYTNGWWTNSVALSAYTGSETRVRFRYDPTGSYWVGLYGVYLDNVSLSNVRMMVWTDLDTNIAAGATNCAVSNRTDGTLFYVLSARNSTNWQAGSPHWIVTMDRAGDVDGDGMANEWECQHFGGVTNADRAGDADGDGFSNWGEYCAGTDPTSDQSFFLAGGRSPTGEVAIYWPSITNRTYVVWRATNLVFAEFSVIASNLPATPAENTYVDTNLPGAGPYYYLIQVQP